MPELLIIKDYISKETCATIIKAMDMVTPYSVVNTQRRKEIPATLTWKVDGREAYDKLRLIKTDVKRRLRKFFTIEGRIYNEYTLLSDLHDGDYHPQHADNEMLKDEKWVPNHTPYRNYTAMLYLNTSGKDFRGGHILFPGLDRDVSPESGLLVGFKCDHEYVHQTTPVTEGHRLALSLWMTSDAMRSEKWN